MGVLITNSKHSNVPMKQWDISKEEMVSPTAILSYQPGDIANAFVYTDAGTYLIKGAQLIQFHCVTGTITTMVATYSIDRVNWLAFPTPVSLSGADFGFVIPEAFQNSWIKLVVTATATYYATQQQHRS